MAIGVSGCCHSSDGGNNIFSWSDNVYNIYYFNDGALINYVGFNK